jgi:hypothetical protein
MTVIETTWNTFIDMLRGASHAGHNTRAKKIFDDYNVNVKNKSREVIHTLSVKLSRDLLQDPDLYTMFLDKYITTIDFDAIYNTCKNLSIIDTSAQLQKETEDWLRSNDVFYVKLLYHLLDNKDVSEKTSQSLLHHFLDNAISKCMVVSDNAPVPITTNMSAAIKYINKQKGIQLKEPARYEREYYWLRYLCGDRDATDDNFAEDGKEYPPLLTGFKYFNDCIKVNVSGQNNGSSSIAENKFGALETGDRSDDENNEETSLLSPGTNTSSNINTTANHRRRYTKPVETRSEQRRYVTTSFTDF